MDSAGAIHARRCAGYSTSMPSTWPSRRCTRCISRARRSRHKPCGRPRRIWGWRRTIKRPGRDRAYGLVDLLCSPNAHTRPIVLLGWRCSSKRAVGDQSSPAPKRYEQAWKDHCKAMRVELPFLAEGVEGGDVVQVLVKEGDQVTEGQSLIELETDKATVPVPAPSAGTATHLLVKKGDHLKVGQALVELNGEGASAPQNTAAPKTAADITPAAEKPPDKKPVQSSWHEQHASAQSAPAPQPPPAVEAAHAKSVEEREKPPAQPSD